MLRETIDVLGDPERLRRYHQRAHANLARWRSAATAGERRGVSVHPGDWGEVTAAHTRACGEIFAVLNMANAIGPGGAYVEGAPAQEENMFRRTDCHFHLTDAEMDPSSERYRPEMTALLNADDGRVYLDTVNPRVCVRGPEDRDAEDLGYRWLSQDEVFPFHELRAAATDLRGGAPFDPVEARRRISAQLDTLIDAGVRHAVLSAFGCGAFRNPAAEVARSYRAALSERAGAFERVAFAVFYPGYGPDNYTPFAAAFAGQRRLLA